MKSLLCRIASRIRQRPQTPEVAIWKKVLDGHLTQSRGGLRVLYATSVGGHDIVRAVDTVVSTALAMRGAQVHVLLCDGILHACEQCAYAWFPDQSNFLANGPQNSLCPNCYGRGAAVWKEVTANLHLYGHFISADERREIEGAAETASVEECLLWKEADVSIGEQVRAAVIRYFGNSSIEDEDQETLKLVSRRYLAAALTTLLVVQRCLELTDAQVVVSHHGIYVPQGIVGQVARSRGVRVVNWATSYRDQTVIFSHGNTYHYTIMEEPVEKWAAVELTPDREKRLLAYLRSRQQGKGDWSFMGTERRGTTDPVPSNLWQKLALDENKPTFALLTNVLWDAQLFYRNNAFRDMLEWLFITIDYFVEHPELQLVVRIHPHERKAGTRQLTNFEIRKHYQTLPSNVVVVDMESEISTYEIVDICRLALIYGTKMGVELTPFGIPVIACGEAWIRGKGISLDIHSKDQYLDVLSSLQSIEQLDENVRKRAQQYAYHFFFRRMIPIKVLESSKTYNVALSFENIEALAAGSDAGLDTICNGILEGSDFIHDD